MLFGLFVRAFCWRGVAWAHIGCNNPLEVRAPIFIVIGLASLGDGIFVFPLAEASVGLSVGAGLLAFGFTLWGIYLGACPFYASDKQNGRRGNVEWRQCCSCSSRVSMIVLVLEEARAANEMILQQIRAFCREKEGTGG